MTVLTIVLNNIGNSPTDLILLESFLLFQFYIAVYLEINEGKNVNITHEHSDLQTFKPHNLLTLK